MSVEPVFVFGYGSLTAAADGLAEHHLPGHTRGWGVAMDNAVDLPRYKYYTDPDTGRRPAVSVLFLDIRPSPGSSVNGALIATTPERLAMLDLRERNYRRREVTTVVQPRPAGRVYAFVGTPDARARCARALAAGTAVVDAGYLEGVRAGFAKLSPGALQRFEVQTESPGCPVRPLRRHDV